MTTTFSFSFLGAHHSLFVLAKSYQTWIIFFQNTSVAKKKCNDLQQKSINYTALCKNLTIILARNIIIFKTCGRKEFSFYSFISNILSCISLLVFIWFNTHSINCKSLRYFSSIVHKTNWIMDTPFPFTEFFLLLYEKLFITARRIQLIWACLAIVIHKCYH